MEDRDDPAEHRLVTRLAWRLIPLLIVLYLAAYIDRQNVGFAKLQMLNDLHMTEIGYGLGSSLFFIGYFVFEIPSTLGVHKFGAKAWFARIMFTWGLVTVLMGITSSATMFYILRFLLGVAEAGFYPGVIYYLTLWFPQAYRVRMIGFFSLGSALGNMFGAMLGGPLLALSGIGGLQGWQWVFFGTGFPAIALTFAVLAFLPSTPATAKFLSSDEKTLLLGILDREKSAGAETGSAIAALWDPKVIGFSAINFFMATGLYCVSYWLPTIVKSFGVTSTVNGLLNMIPWGLAAVMLVSLPFLMRTDRAVLRGVTLMTAFGAICFVASTLVPGNWTRFTCVVLGTPVLSLMYPCFWSLPPRFFSGARAAASIAVINSVGNLGGFFAQNLDPWISTATGSMIAPMLAPAVCLIAIGAAAFVARRIMIRPRPLIADAIPVH